jgi:hypothetical protein
MLSYHLKLYFEDCWNCEHTQDVHIDALCKEEALEAALDLVKDIVNSKCWEFTKVETLDIRDTRN